MRRRRCTASVQTAQTLVPAQTRIGECRILTGRRVINSFLKRQPGRPFFSRAHIPVPRYLVEAPENFETMPVRVAEFHRDLRAGPPAAAKISSMVDTSNAIWWSS